jgi:hypothetical protein
MVQQIKAARSGHYRNEALQTCTRFRPFWAVLSPYFKSRSLLYPGFKLREDLCFCYCHFVFITINANPVLV